MTGALNEHYPCPDGGTCHHGCMEGDCFRVRTCEPLSGVFANDEWPARYKRTTARFAVDEREKSHYEAAREAGVDHSHAVQLGRYFCHHEGGMSPCDQCVLDAIPALVWLGRDRPTTLVRALKAGSEHSETSPDRTTALALLSIAEAMHEANVEARARDMARARLTITGEWAEGQLHALIASVLLDVVDERSERDSIADAVVDSYRDAMTKAEASL